MDSKRLIVVSNRLPIGVRVAGNAIHFEATSGGLATGLRPLHEASGGLWVGWPGDVSGLSTEQRVALDRRLYEQRVVPVYLSNDQIERYYHGFANRVIWPLFHYLIDRVPVDAVGWDAYRQVNERFAESVAREYREGDTIWVHDYQLMLVPQLLRDRLPRARIGFFLHIPFPSSEVFRTLPWRREILDGLLGADLLGFHTFAYQRHFAASLLHVAGIEAEIDRIRLDDREVRWGVFPMGVDAGQLDAAARDPEVAAAAAEIRRDAGERRIILGVDRLDYTKGIPRRLQAIERLLDREPSLRDSIRYIQVAVPSRGGVDSYRRFRRQVEEMVGRINGSYGTLRSTPVHYMHRSVSPRELTALYCAADVMVVTPLRDGMNLVAKEFVASRFDEDGVLVLSEFAGSAEELCGAMSVNPYDIDGVATAIGRASSMGSEERRARMGSMRRRVMECDVHSWARAYVACLETTSAVPASAGSDRPQPALVSALESAQRQGPVRLLLDYDGTLVPIARSPEQAAPDEGLMTLLERLASARGLDVQLVSGRPRETLADWFGQLPITLWAEHGFWHRPGPDRPWQSAIDVSPDWAARVMPILEQFTASTPGSRIEVKSASVVWHFRGAPRDFGARQAHELRMWLGDALSNQPLEVLEGKKVIEVRVRGVSKGAVAPRLAAAPMVAVAFGDDRSDAELFRSLPPQSITVAVGSSSLGSRYCVADHRAVRQLLRLMIGTSEEIHAAKVAAEAFESRASESGGRVVVTAAADQDSVPAAGPGDGFRGS